MQAWREPVLPRVISAWITASYHFVGEKMLRNILIMPLALLSACATLVNGTNQAVTVSTSPAGAACTIDRIGERVGAIANTPGSVRVDKSKNDLSVTCSKEGFQTASVTHSPNFSGVTFGNLIAGGVIGIVVDASSGANFNYPSDIRLDLTPLTPKLPPVTGRDAPTSGELPLRVRASQNTAASTVATAVPVSTSLR